MKENISLKRGSKAILICILVLFTYLKVGAQDKNAIKYTTEYIFDSDYTDALRFNTNYAGIFTAYNENGNVSRVDSIRDTRYGLIIKSYQLIYDSLNRLIEQNIHDEDSLFMGRKQFYYSGDKLSQIEQYDKYGTLKGRCIVSNPVSTIEKYTWLSKDNDTLAAQEYLAVNGTLIKKTERYFKRNTKVVRAYNYNQHGDLEIRFNENYTQEWKDSFEYNYDSFGNWVFRKSFNSKGEIESHSYKIIEYASKSQLERGGDILGYWVSQKHGRLGFTIYLDTNDSVLISSNLLFYLSSTYWDITSETGDVRLSNKGVYSLNEEENRIEITLDDIGSGQLFYLNTESGVLQHATLKKEFRSPHQRSDHDGFIHLKR